MDVAVIGAGGDCGRQTVVQLIAERVLDPSDRLQLVGRADGPSGRVLHGLCADLSDAYAEITPELDVALRPADIVADVVVLAAGTANPPPTLPPTRDTLAALNGPVFDGYARALAEHGSGQEIVVVVSNPVELGVELLARRLDRRRVIGIGAWQDTLRFRREVADQLGVRRQRVSGFVVGEHGDAMVPLWSTLAVQGLEPAEQAQLIEPFRVGRSVGDFAARVAAARESVMVLVRVGRTAEALAEVARLPPDLRVAVKPFVTHFCGAKTAVATANVAVDVVRTLLDGRDTVAAGQVRLAGEFADLGSPDRPIVFGVPLVIGSRGWSQILRLEPTAEERAAIAAAAGSITEKLNRWTEGLA